LVIDIKFFTERIAFYTNKKYFEGPRLKKGNKVYFLQQNIQTTRPSNKLDYKKLRPFVINQVLKPVNYKLQLPDYIQIYPVFYILFLEPVPANTKIIVPELLTKEDKQEYKVERVIDYSNTNNKRQYLIK
jgi:effector-binding domain-containing protein